MFKSKKAFTLIELLVVIAIIGILATISVLALSNARAKSRDAKRAGDVKQIQTALELFFNDKGRYPNTEEWATGQIFSTTTDATSTYMQIIPSAPTPADGSCNNNQNTIGYVPTADGSSYSISFCLGNTTGTLTSGPKCLTPGGIIDVDCGLVPPGISGLKLWLRADAGVELNGTTVLNWKDQSGNGYDVTQSTEAYQPTLIENSLNGLPGLGFSGDYLQGGTITGLGAGDITAFVVASGDSLGWADSFNAFIAIDNLKFGLATDPMGQNFNYLRGGDYTWPSVADFPNSGWPAQTLSVIKRIGSSATQYVNGTEYYVDGYPGVVFDDSSFMVGASGGSWGGYHIGKIYEIILYSSALSETDRQKIENYLNDKYNLY